MWTFSSFKLFPKTFLCVFLGGYRFVPKKFSLFFIELQTWLLYFIYGFITFYCKFLLALTLSQSAFFYLTLLETTMCFESSSNNPAIQKVSNNDLKLLIIFLKNTILDVWQWSECTSAISSCYSFTMSHLIKSALFISFF